MTLAVTTFLGLLFVALAIINASLMAWLWRFPLDNVGNSTAPRAWVKVHRGIGYTFATIYVVMVAVMLPRLWQYKEFTATSLIHIALGLVVAPTLISKILIIRRFKILGGKLPWFGGTLAATAIIGVGAALLPSLKLQSGPSGEGKTAATTSCVQCHGASRIVSEGRTPDGWRKVGHEMLEKAEDLRRPLTESAANSAAGYLSATVPGREGGQNEEDGGRGRRRRVRDRDED